MNVPPWVLLRRRRIERGLTQAKCAEGIVTQSMLSQMERGRILPSIDTLYQLASRLGVDSGTLVDEWSSWRVRNRLRESLWNHFLAGQARPISTRLSSPQADILVPFERHVYVAWVGAVLGSIDDGERYLQAAWACGAVPGVGPSSARALQTPDVSTPDFHGAWSKRDRDRILVVEARTQSILCTMTGRHAAATVWAQKELHRRGNLSLLNETSMV